MSSNPRKPAKRAAGGKRAPQPPRRDAKPRSSPSNAAPSRSGTAKGTPKKIGGKGASRGGTAKGTPKEFGGGASSQGRSKGAHDRSGFGTGRASEGSRRATRPDEAARGRSGAGTPVPGKGRTRTGAAGKGATSSGATGKGAAGRVPSKRQAKPPKPRARPSDGPPPPPLGEPGEAIRLQRVLSAAGVASRRAAEDLITSGRVSVDGKVVRTLGTRVDPETARIEVDGERIGVRRNRQYLIMNKPVGVITSASDPFGRKTVLDLVRVRGRVFPVGRLDSDTSGLLLLTDDGELAHRLAHPRYGIEKVYVAKVAGRVETATLKRLEKGIRLDDGPARAVRARLRGKASKTSQVEIVMAEGRKREVRRMLEAVGHPVDELVRVAYGPIRLSGLVTGDVRELTIAEIGELYRLVGL